MDYYLQNVRTGETAKLSPDRTLIGTAEHATIPVESGPYLAAFAVRYPTGWALFGLSDDETVTFNRQPLRPGQRVSLHKGALLTAGDERFTLLHPRSQTESEAAPANEVPPVCLLEVRYPDGQEECRAVDHDLLFGRLPCCHVHFADTRLSRFNALLACDSNAWFIHNLTKKVIGRNRKPVPLFARLEDGDELQIGPLLVRVELRSASDTPPPPQRVASHDAPASVRHPAAFASAMVAEATDFPDATDDGTSEQPTGSNLDRLREHAQNLDHWLKAHPPRPETKATKGAIGGWLEAQRDKLRRFWFDTPETATARSMRAAGRFEDAFGVLDRAIRARPDSPDLLRELYRLYDAIGLYEFCYRPLRQIEKLAEMRGSPDPWVLETLARICERLGHERPSMTDRAVGYWTKLEAATGANHRNEKADVMARRALREGGYAGTSGDGV